MKIDDVESVVARVAWEVVDDLGIQDLEQVGESAIYAAYARLWEIDKVSIEMHTDRSVVLRALQDAVREKKGGACKVPLRLQC